MQRFLESQEAIASRPAMTVQCLSVEPASHAVRWKRAAATVDSAIEIYPLAANFDVGLVDMPPPGDGALAPVKARQQRGRETNGLAVDGLV